MIAMDWIEWLVVHSVLVSMMTNDIHSQKIENYSAAESRRIYSLIIILLYEKETYW